MYVTGTFDDWGKTVKLDRMGDIFEKKVSLSATNEKIHYKVRDPCGALKLCLSVSMALDLLADVTGLPSSEL